MIYLNSFLRLMPGLSTQSSCRTGIRFQLCPGSGVAYKLSEEIYAAFWPSQRGCPASSTWQPWDWLPTWPGLTGECALHRPTRPGSAQETTQRLGLKTIMENGGTRPAALTEEHIGFVLDQRLNALGRLGNANPAVELLTTSDAVRARVLADAA